MMSSKNEICLNQPNNIVKFANEGIQTEGIWNEDISSVTDVSDESLIDLSSSFDDSEDSLGKVSSLEKSLFKSTAEIHSLPIALFGNESSELCKAFCKTYKEFFKDVYQKEDRLAQTKTIGDKKTTTGK